MRVDLLHVRANCIHGEDARWTFSFSEARGTATARDAIATRTRVLSAHAPFEFAIEQGQTIVSLRETSVCVYTRSYTYRLH